MRASLNAVFALLSIVAVKAQETEPPPPAQPPVILRDLAKPRWFGTAANTSWLFNDANYTEVAKTQFSRFTPENEMKWEMIEPQPGVFNWEPFDKIVAFAKSVGAIVHGHTFVWHSQLAPWVNSSLTSTQLDKALKNHITTIMTRYKGQIYAYDVINELVADDAPNNTFKNNIWTQKFGENAIPMAFRYAREADPGAKLYYNDYRIEGINNKSNTLYELVKGYLRDGVPIDGVGFQAHFGLGVIPQDIAQNLKRFTDLGLEVTITELDINMRAPANQTNLIQQAKDYYQVVSACVAVPKCTGVSVWGISDRLSWIAPPNGNVLPWDAQSQPKPAFYAIADALQGKPFSFGNYTEETN